MEIYRFQRLHPFCFGLKLTWTIYNFQRSRPFCFSLKWTIYTQNCKEMKKVTREGCGVLTDDVKISPTSSQGNDVSEKCPINTTAIHLDTSPWRPLDSAHEIGLCVCRAVAQTVCVSSGGKQRLIREQR